MVAYWRSRLASAGSAARVVTDWPDLLRRVGNIGRGGVGPPPSPFGTRITVRHRGDQTRRTCSTRSPQHPWQPPVTGVKDPTWYSLQSPFIYGREKFRGSGIFIERRSSQGVPHARVIILDARVQRRSERPLRTAATPGGLKLDASHESRAWHPAVQLESRPHARPRGASRTELQPLS